MSTLEGYPEAVAQALPRRALAGGFEDLVAALWDRLDEEDQFPDEGIFGAEALEDDARQHHILRGAGKAHDGGLPGPIRGRAISHQGWGAPKSIDRLAGISPALYGGGDCAKGIGL
ncbi:unnamed protein product [Nippostrongylus brasiliensis]|uniref:Uncharacterized protein n=1 Tax=Nippostrongylus brasiliensis TaxID=27835 RepID=A0A3P7AEV4_NIPBR|nr:unnamed protein product [Nippostrongylus brasiliensis]